MKIRSMTLEDVKEVYDIEKRAHITPWSESILHDCIVVGYPCYVLIAHNIICGFMITRQQDYKCHLLNLCIAPEYQGRGFGESLLLYLMKNTKSDCAQILLEVRPSNFAATHLYYKHGFKQIGLKKDYYHDLDGTFEDALLLSYKR